MGVDLCVGVSVCGRGSVCGRVCVWACVGRVGVLLDEVVVILT